MDPRILFSLSSNFPFFSPLSVFSSPSSTEQRTARARRSRRAAASSLRTSGQRAASHCPPRPRALLCPRSSTTPSRSCPRPRPTTAGTPGPSSPSPSPSTREGRLPQGTALILPRCHGVRKRGGRDVEGCHRRNWGWATGGAGRRRRHH